MDVPLPGFRATTRVAPTLGHPCPNVDRGACETKLRAPYKLLDIPPFRRTRNVGTTLVVARCVWFTQYSAHIRWMFRCRGFGRPQGIAPTNVAKYGARWGAQ